MEEKDIRANLDDISVPETEVEEEVTGLKSEEEEPAVEAPKSEETEEESEETEDTAVEKDPPRVPYSRFETVNERAIRAEEQLKIYQQREEQDKLAQASSKNEDGLPAYWVKLYGDSEASVEAYQLRQQELAEERETLKTGLREDLYKEQQEQETRQEETVKDWSSQIDEFAETNKRKFTDSQTDALLDVMDELTPKDANGNYIVEPIQYLPQAVELYDLRTERANASKKASRQATAKLTSAKGEGNPTATSDNWDGNWEKKLTRMGL